MDLIEIIVIVSLVVWYGILFYLLKSVRDLTERLKIITCKVNRLTRTNLSIDRPSKLVWDED